MQPQPAKARVSLTEVPAGDFSNLYLSEHQCAKTRRRTRDWTIPMLHWCGIERGKILSAGCGNGMDVVELRQQDYEAFGVDLYPPAEEARGWTSIAAAVVCLHILTDAL